MEIDLGLLKDETYGLDARYIWEVSRFGLQTRLNRKLSLHEQAHTLSTPLNQMSVVAFISFGARFLYSIVVKNWLWAPKNREWLIFQHPRHKKKSGFYEDIYTDDLIDEIGIEKCVIIERSYLRRHYKPKRHNVYYFEFLSIFSRFAAFLMLFCHKYNEIAINNMINDIDTYIENKLEQEETNVRKEFKTKSFYAFYIAYLFMLKWLKPRKIMLIVSYGFEPLIYAASVLNIPTVELQHGVITQDHLGYSVPINVTKKLFPDYLLLFGKYWKDNMDTFPLTAERLIIFGYPYLENIKKNTYNTINKENQVVIISQGTIGRELSKFAVKLATINKGVYKIIYKLHPGEIGREKEIYSELFNAKEMGLLEIVDTDIPALYTLLSQSRWQIGVNSTALFEGIVFGCQTILVDLPGVEYMIPLLKNGFAQLVKKPEDIQFAENKSAIVLHEELFASDWRSNWHKFEQLDLRCRY